MSTLCTGHYYSRDSKSHYNGGKSGHARSTDAGYCTGSPCRCLISVATLKVLMYNIGEVVRIKRLGKLGKKVTDDILKTVKGERDTSGVVKDMKNLGRLFL